MEKLSNITGIILAGGKSLRMGTDKGFVLWRDKPFIQYSIDALKPIVDQIIIVSDYPEYDMLGYKRIKDCFPKAGPLSGLYSGLKESTTELNLVLSCDVPLISSDILENLLAKNRKGVSAVVCKISDKIMPLVAMYHKNCCAKCEALLKANERRMMCLLDELPNTIYVTLDKTQVESVSNINSLKDLNKLNNAS